MKYKTSELAGALLDATVAKAEGFHIRADCRWQSSVGWELPPQFSSDWRIGGPLIERERIAIWFDGEQWGAHHDNLHGCGGYYPCSSCSVGTAIDMSIGDGHQGATPLVAAMRAYVGSKLGHQVELP